MYHINLQFTVDKHYITFFIEKIVGDLVKSSWVVLDHLHVVWQPEQKSEEEQ